MSNFTDDEGNVVFKEIAEGDAGSLLEKSLDAMNTSKDITGEEYIEYKQIGDNINHETTLNDDAIELFHKTNSACFNVKQGILNTPKQAHKMFRFCGMKDAYKMFYKLEEGSFIANNITTEQMYKDIHQTIVRQRCIDMSWPHQIGSQLIIIRDYWGEYVGHHAKGVLKPIDFAACLQDIINSVGHFLYDRKQETVYGYDEANKRAKEQTTESCVREWIGEYIKAHPNYVHPKLQQVIDMIDAKQDERAMHDSDAAGGE